MIAGLPLGFAEPLVLLGLISLPALWWLLRLVPPRPRRIAFPPTRSPPSTRTSARDNAMTSARSSLVARTSGDAKTMDADRSGQIQTVCAASHSCSRTYR